MSSAFSSLNCAKGDVFLLFACFKHPHLHCFDSFNHHDGPKISSSHFGPDIIVVKIILEFLHFSTAQQLDSLTICFAFMPKDT